MSTAKNRDRVATRPQLDQASRQTDEPARADSPRYAARLARLQRVLTAAAALLESGDDEETPT
ncbi:MAG: hypothetical protein HYR72_15155 [Deltaproteobacteria bacterium]|nr:hypothetical protein [Deltaproteobacteria bacterium]MBI3390944.1 hypothetical protein [Deltaproteobacteria bacterium]